VATLTSKTLAFWTLLLATAAVGRPVWAEPAPEDPLAYDRVTELGGVSLNRDATHVYATIEPWQGRLEIVRYALASGEGAPETLFAPPAPV